MSEDEIDESAPMMTSDAEIKALMGLFDLPAFARRGQDLESALKRLHHRCRKHREDMLEMVQVRLKQWSRVATGPEDLAGVFAAPLDDLCALGGGSPSNWAGQPASDRQRRAVGLDLVASVDRFNRRWMAYLESLNLGPLNQMIDHYNRYYLIEKECVLGSPRLANRHFAQVPRLSPTGLLEDHPLLPVPQLLNPA